MKKTIFKDTVSCNILYLTLIVFVISLQVLIVLIFIYQYVPLPVASIAKGVPPALLKLYQPNRNDFFYHAFIAAAIIGQITVLYVFRKRLTLLDLAGNIRQFLICETFWVLWQLLAMFKMMQYQNPRWAQVLWCAGFAAALLAKIFWTELNRGLKRFQVWLGTNMTVSHKELADAGIILLLLLVIAIPDTEKALLRMAIFDSNNHFDQWLMAPLWAYHKGLIPGAQAFAPLNWGAIVLTNALVGIIGGMTYGQVIGVLCFLAVIYYTAFYYLLRFWLGVLPAAFGVLLAVKLQMFHMGVSPLIWVYPGQSILRHLFDVAVFFCLLLFSRGQGEIFLWSASVLVGVSLAFVFDTGFYMLGALYAYLAALLVFKETRLLLCPTCRQWRKILWTALLPWLVMIITLLFCIGPSVFHREFWTNSFIDLPRWLNGQDVVSIYSCLKDRNFFAFFASFFPPLLYTAGMAVAISMIYFRRWTCEKLFLIPLSVYGLGVYAHFLWHATINYYYLVPLPLVGCLCFWGTKILDGMVKVRQRLVKFILVFLTGVALFTNFLFTYYPNVFNLAGENGEQLKAMYRTNYNFDRDADFIRHWTWPGSRVALISGFTTPILMQADRASFFYGCLPLISVEDLGQLLDQLDQNKPAQVFIDKAALNSSGDTPLKALTDYLKTHYHYSGQQSDRLALLKRNDEQVSK